LQSGYYPVKSLQKVLTQLKHLDRTGDGVFSLFIFSIGYGVEKEVTIENSVESDE
jgi:hypothetical protein